MLEKLLPDALPRDLLVRIALALCIGVASGALAAWAGLPLPWMLGPMLGNTAAALLRLPVSAPGGIRKYIVPVIGVFLGASFYPGMGAQALSWGVTALLLPVFCVAAAAVSYSVYRRIGGYDPVTAFFSAVPGGLNEMMIIGEDAGGDGRRIALAHATRILLVIAAVALFFGLALGVSSGDGPSRWTSFADVGVLDGLALAACAVFGPGLAQRARMPAAAMLGPMILSGVLHLTGLVVVPPPTVLVIIAQICIGTLIGCRFVGVAPRQVARDLQLGLVSALGMLSVALVFAEAVHLATGRPMSQAFLAFSPGGLTEMSLLALAMGQEVAYVASAHVARIVLVVFSTPVAFRWLNPGPRTDRAR